MYDLEERDRQRMYKNQDEVDLTHIFRLFGRFFQKIGNGIRFAIIALFRHWVVVSLILLVGLGFGFAAYYMTKPYYTSSMTLVLADIRNEFVENHLTNLSDMINEGNISAISESLDLGPEAAKEIKEMKFLNLDQERISEDSILKGSPFMIQLTLYNNALFESMEPALTNYLENNRYFSKQKLIRQREVESLITKLKAQIESIDSIKTTVVSPRGPVNGFVYGEPIDPTNLYKESMTLYQEQVKLEAELDQLDNIQVVNGFTPRFRPTGPDLLKFLLIGGAISFIIGLIVALVLESRRRSRLAY
ncbi:chain length determinant protein [Pontibacter toksunensis]|uniref:Chain length determinant protein n=1 Tax=Pontibacter toksunensis TaxID=1332631 RepID=A0ABW6BNY1_9BACT